MNIIEQLRKLQGRIRTLSFRKSHSDHQFATSLKLAREAFSNGAGLDEAVHKLDGVGDEFTALRVDTASDLIEAVRIGKQYEIQMPNCLLLRESFGENFENLVPLVCAELEALKLSLEVSTTKPTDTADTKTDTQKNSGKKRQLSSAGGSCAIYVRDTLKDDPTADRLQTVKDWAESKNGEWEGKKISVKSIYRQLTDNPESWKSE